MSSAIEVLKKYSTSCSVCKYDGGDQCKASGGEFGECKPAEELSKAINKALLALEQKEKLVEWLEKEISGKEMLKVHLKYQALEIIETEIKVLKEVLERVGEQ